MTMTDAHEATERPPVEVVDRPEGPAVDLPEEVTGAEVERYESPAVSSLERAAEAAMSMPGLPGRDEFLMLAVQARLISMSAGAPEAVRNNPHLAFHMAMLGRDLGISVTAAIVQIDVIGYDKKKANPYEDVQLSISPELLNGQIRRLGLGSIRPKYRDAEKCIAVALAPDGEELGETEFTWAEAQQAGLVDRRCANAFDHWTNPNTRAGEEWKNDNKCKCRQGWRTYPKRMLWWRAAGYAATDYFPEASIGLYSPEELGAVVDAEGRPIDPSTVELPDGYEPKAIEPPPPDPADDLLAEAEAGSDLATLRDTIRAQVDAITVVPEAAEALRLLWEETTEGQDGAEPTRKTPPFGRLRRRHMVRVRAIVKSVEDRLKRGEWGDDAKAAWADAAVAGAGFGNTTAAKPEAQDFQTGGKSPHDLARERRAREAAAQVAAEAAAEAANRGGEAPGTPQEGDGGAEHQTPGEPASGHEAAEEPAEDEESARDREVLDEFERAVAAPGHAETCSGCGQEFARTASGQPSPGPKGRDKAHPSFHRECAPFD
jgi:hypothetical protein